MPELMQFLLSGVTVGAVYALVALGFTIIYNASDVVNFAQGEFVMLGGMVLSALGVMAAYMALIYEEIKHRPLYIVNRPEDNTSSRLDQ